MGERPLLSGASRIHCGFLHMKKKREPQDVYDIVPESSENTVPSGEMQVLPRSYDNHLELAGQIADQLALTDAFAEAHATWTVTGRSIHGGDI